MKFTVALAQIDTALADPSRNVRRHVDAVRTARDGGADLVVFPELSLTGYSIKDSTRDLALRLPEGAAVLDPLIRESGDISILVGCVEQSKEFGLFNSAVLIERGTARSVHRKVYLPTYGMFEEGRHFSPGRSVRAFDSAPGRLGVLVCEDLWHLPLPYLLAQDGAQVIIGMAASPARLAGDAEKLQNAEANGEQHRAFARLLSVYVLFCNRVGIEDGVNFWGGSEIVSPRGQVVARAKLFEEDLLYAELDDREVEQARFLSRHYLDDRPELVSRELQRIRAESRQHI
jgi:predicted amidohydrolase